ncbi:DUF3885 domain-containing protein [Miniphocaeibacter massiliensis]|uniref:DUF3885 domain-containing protein n=1 Tax=Miniphocaeibacter massiliensis TaxID=2041841 RepID=UPI000C08A28B|nr:DUF3885 domain-containing protein [Miniphocaeibacter massiliensis]
MLKEKVKEVKRKLNGENIEYIYNSKYYLRFDIEPKFSPFNKNRHIEKYYFKAARKTALEIYNSLEFNFNILILELSWYGEETYENEISKKFDNEFKNYVETIKLPYPKEEDNIRVVKYIEEDPIGEFYEGIRYTKLYYWNILENKLYINRLFLEITKKDFGGKIEGMNSYLVDTENIVVLNFYDDRRMDLISDSREKLFPYYEMLNKYLLDYNRKTMNEIFKNKDIE